MTDDTIIQEGVVRFEVQEVRGPVQRYRANIVGCDFHAYGNGIREAVRGAASIATTAEYADELGELWDGDSE